MHVAEARGPLGDRLNELAAAIVALARAQARAVDVAAAADPWAVTAAAREFRRTLAQMHLDPTSRGATSSDPLDNLLATLNVPTRTGTGPLGDPPKR